MAENHFVFNIILILLVVLNALSFLSCFWSVEIDRICNYSHATQNEATHVLVTPQPNKGLKSIESIKTNKKHGKYFIFMKLKFIFDPSVGEFVLPAHPDDMVLPKNSILPPLIKNDEDVEALRWKFGSNQMKIELPSFFSLFMEKATAPFFVFQTFCMILWCLDEYWVFPITSLFMLVALEGLNTLQQLKHMGEIRQLGNSRQFVTVNRQSKWLVTCSTQLVPRDIVFIDGSKNANSVIHCDMLLLQGSCVTDESLLTGESLPVMKEPAKDIGELDLKKHGKLHLLYSGTKFIDCTEEASLSGLTNRGCLCVVVRTGFSTYQGKLLKIILQNAGNTSLESSDSLLLILLLLIFGLAASAYVWLYAGSEYRNNEYKLLLKCVFIVTSILPPELPLELSLAVNASLKALSQARIFCTESFRIPFAGHTTICCFDKTGTLTSDHFIMAGVNGLDNSADLVQECSANSLMAMGSCNSLHLHKSAPVGDVMELELLTFSGYKFSASNKLERTNPKNRKIPPKIEILRRFHFSSALRRMSVICRYFPENSNITKYFVAVKGAPEALKEHFADIPRDYDEIVQNSMSVGYRVLAVGFRHCDRCPDLRSSAEPTGKLEFCGFVNFTVEIKPDSYTTVEQLQSSSHHVMMITGDSLHTAFYVAKELGIVKSGSVLNIEDKSGELVFTLSKGGEDKVVDFEFVRTTWTESSICMTGDALNALKESDEDFLKIILPGTCVLARTDPQQKQYIVTVLRSLGHYITMCGDGTNDVGALKQAHIGVAVPSRDIPEVPASLPKNDLLSAVNEDGNHLTELGDASIASPFSSKKSSPICVRDIIREGRGAFVKTLQMFKILALNAFISSYGQSVLYLNAVRIGDLQATVQGVCCTFLVFNITSSMPADVISSIRPPKSFFTIPCLVSVFGQFFVHFGSLIFMNAELFHYQSTYNISVTNITLGNNTSITSEAIVFSPSISNSCIWLLSLAMDVNACLVNYRGRPFMKSLKEQKTLLYGFLIIHGFILSLLFGLIPDIQQKLSVVNIPELLKDRFIIIVAFNFILTYCINAVCEHISDRLSICDNKV